MNLSNKTVEWLRKNNYKVKIHHYRVKSNDLSKHFSLKDITDSSLINGKGGKTQVFLTSLDKKEYVGTSYCNGNDNFNYKLGVKIALGRLQKITN